MFEASFNATLDRYRKWLEQAGMGRPDLANDNFDVGEYTKPGDYRMSDDTYATLLDKLAERQFASAPADLRAEILRFYGQPDAPYATKRDAKVWARVLAELEQLKAATPGQVQTTVPMAALHLF